ncbi:MAG: 16S rRNA (cytosine(1402)-N(4))-methyltransferase RsmH [Flavobacteriales bacterium]
MKEETYHTPVLLHDSIDGLNINPDGVYVDATFGGGGHSRELLKRLDKGRLIAFDQDPDAQRNTIDDPRFTLVAQNFRFMKNYLRFYGIKEVDGVLADLGVSSHQFDEGERGFSIRFDAPLDMRMSQNGDLSAKQVINNWEESELTHMFKSYGELSNARKISQLIVEAREDEEITTTADLLKALTSVTPPIKQHKFQAQVFQAIRIAVNQEMEALEEMLEQSIELLKPNGRLSVITYHSLEDRMVKYFMRSGNKKGEVEKDFFGNQLSPVKPLIKGSSPGAEETRKNPRARSARLRVAVKVK